jgi:pyroglutamyl-peptidase
VRRRPRLLVTGFGPFPGIPRNPSAEVAHRLAASPRWRRLGIEVRARVLPTTYAALEAELAPALAEGFDAVLMIGVAGRSRRVRVEGRASNRSSILHGDAAKRRPERMAQPGLPAFRRCRADVRRVVAALQEHGVPAAPSQDAGRYLCNASYLQALAGPAPVLFLHIPKGPRRTRKKDGAPQRRAFSPTLARAFEEAGLELLRLARATPARPG